MLGPPFERCWNSRNKAWPVYYMKYPLETIESAVQGVKNLLELARKNKGLEGFLFFNSSEIYGDPDPKSVPTPAKIESDRRKHIVRERQQYARFQVRRYISVSTFSSVASRLFIGQ